MITVTSDYKTAVKADAKEIKAYLTDKEVSPTEITESDDLKSIIIKQESQILHTIMRQADIIHLGTVNYLDTDVSFGVGVILPDTSTEYIDYGTFKVVEREVDKATGDVKLKAYDKMYEALVDWGLEPIYDITYPTTLKGLLEAICDKLGWYLGTATFPNDDTAISMDLFTGVVKTYRDVLEYIAEASASIVYFDVDDTLKVRQISHSGSLETLNKDVLASMKVESKFGNINSVVLARTPQEDNIVQKDDDDIALNGLTEIKIPNNIIMDSARETWITEVYTELLGLGFYPFEASTFGLGYIQIGDRITLTDPTGASFEVVVMKITTSITGGFKEEYSADRPDKSNTNYNRAGIIGQRIRNTEIIVNKQTGEIQLLVTTTDGLTSIVLDPDGILQTVANTVDTQQEQITELEQTVETLELLVSGTGGTNLLKNSVGLKGDLEEWISDTDVRNDGTIINTTDVQNNSESGSAIEIEDEYIVQTVNTIVGELYTLYFRYRTDGDLTVNITGMEEATLGDSDDEWLVYKVQTPAILADTIIRLESATGVTAQITDITFKLGDVNGWIQAPNEVYGSNFKFDKDGFEITSLTDTFKSLLDNTKLAVYDTSSGDKIMMLVSKDSGKITNLVAQDELTIQRYENSSSSLRFIPVDDGAYIVIND